MPDGTVNVAIVGLGFGAEFIPIYQDHPSANLVAVCRRNEEKLNKIADHYGVERRYTAYDELLKDDDINGVHINTPIPDHATHSLKALDAGKHVSCTVPMGVSVEECRKVVDKVEETGLKYTMAETVVYSREFLFVKEMYENGELGRLQFLKSSHPQDMEGWPSYWEKMIPMHYATHVVSPILSLVGEPAETVSCFGSGKQSDELIEKSGNPHAVQTCHMSIKNTDLTGHIWRFLFDTARQYRESFDVYGSEKSFEWPLIEDEDPVVHTASKPEDEIPERVDVPDYAHLLPEPIQQYTQAVHDEDHLSFVQGGGHGGSHPHLAHEFVNAINEDRQPYPDAKTAANWTCVGLIAHESSMNGGERMDLPDFTV